MRTIRKYDIWVIAPKPSIDDEEQFLNSQAANGYILQTILVLPSGEYKYYFYTDIAPY